MPKVTPGAKAVIEPLVEAAERSEKKGRTFAELKADHKEKAKASLRGTKGIPVTPGGKATPEDVDVAMGAADPWDGLALPVDVDAGLHVYRASLIGACVTALVALNLKEKLGLDVAETLPPSIQAAAQAGTDAEPAIIAKFCEEFGYRRATYPELEKLTRDGVIAGYNPAMGQVQVRKMVGKKAVLRSHPDSIVTINGETFADLEVKFLGADLYKAFKKGGLDKMGNIGQKYAWQISARMGSHGLPLIFVGAEKLGGTAGTEIGEVEPIIYAVGEAPIKWKKIKKKIEECEEFVKEGVLPDLCGKGTFACPAFKLPQCKNPDKPDARTQEELDDQELGHLLALQFALNTDKREAEAELKKINPQIAKLKDSRYPTADGYSYIVKDEAGNTFKWEWQEQDRKGYTVEPSHTAWSKVTLVGKADDGE